VAETQLAAAKPFGEDGSIKNNKLCETKPIYEEQEMTLNHYITKDYDNNSPLLMMEKQTQSKPIFLILMVCRVCD
jgi:hypothetical protein